MPINRPAALGGANPGAPAQPVIKRAKPAPGLPGYYSYTDESGTSHIVDDYEKVPERYR